MTHTTTIGRAVLAMLVGAVVGGNLSMGLLIAGFGAPEPGQTFQIWIVMQAYWLGGILIFAAIPFVLMHISNLRQWYGMTFIGVITMMMLSTYAFKGVEEGNSSLVLAGIGGIVGWVIWRVAYRRALGGIEYEMFGFGCSAGGGNPCDSARSSAGGRGRVCAGWGFEPTLA